MMMGLSYCHSILKEDDAKFKSLEKARDIYSRLVLEDGYKSLSPRQEK